MRPLDNAIVPSDKRSATPVVRAAARPSLAFPPYFPKDCSYSSLGLPLFGSILQTTHSVFGCHSQVPHSDEGRPLHVLISLAAGSVYQILRVFSPSSSSSSSPSSVWVFSLFFFPIFVSCSASVPTGVLAVKAEYGQAYLHGVFQ